MNLSDPRMQSLIIGRGSESHQPGKANDGAIVKPHLDWTSSLPLNLFITEDMPALTPVITAKLRACIKGPPARACNLKEN